MAHHISRDIPPLTNAFTENTDISLDSNRHMMLHELRKLMQEIRNMKVDLHHNEEKSRRLKIENDARMQKLLNEMKEMKLYINELEMEKQRTNAENNEIKTRVIDIIEKHNQEINELRTKISGQEIKNSELETKCCQMQTENAIIKENVSAPIIINGLYEQMMEDSKSREWSRSGELMKKHLDQSAPAYEQLNNITNYYNYPVEAANRGYVELIQVMLDNDLPIYKRYTFHNHTILHVAASYGEHNVVKFLIQRGADFNGRDKRGRTPLHSAVLGGHVNVAELLVDSGADINATNYKGNTPLHNAVKYENKQLVQWLIKEDCNTIIRNRRNQTALDCAKTQEIKDIIKGQYNFLESLIRY